MKEEILRIVKRDGHVQPFDPDKIRQAIIKAYRAGGIYEEAARIDSVVEAVTNSVKQGGELVTVEQVQDRVEEELMRLNPFIAKKYIIYREWRTVERDKRTSMKHTMDGIVSIEKNDVNLGNANMSSHTPAGQMMTFASEVTKDYACKYLLPLRYSRAHRAGDIHIHDLDYYPTKTTTCVQYDIADLYERGFRTKNGSIRTPQSIHSYATLATIIFQTNQNEQHGGQAIPAFDFFMAPGVIKSFLNHLIDRLRFVLELHQPENTDLSANLSPTVRGLDPLLTDSAEEANRLHQGLSEASFPFSKVEVEAALRTALRKTRSDTHQAMEGFIHNLNTMHSRGGNQVVFSSINYGTDTSAAGRMVIEELLLATEEGLGHGEVPIFPIQIFKVKEDINYSEKDYKLAMDNFEDALAGKIGRAHV